MTEDVVESSLILTVLNEERTLPGFLASVSEQTRLPDEIVIVDGGSTDSTLEVLTAWQPPCGIDVVIRQTRGCSISAGRNEAVREARGELLLVTDGGTALDRHWVELLVNALRRGADVASGFFVPDGRSTLQRTIGSVITPTVDEIDGDRFLPSSRSVAFRRDALSAVGGYPEWLDYCEDLVLDLSLKRAGYAFEFVPEAIATWDSRPSFGAFARQYYRYARGDAKAGLWPKRHLIRFAAYLAGVGLLVAAAWHPWPALVLLATGGLFYMWKFFRRVAARRRALGLPLVQSMLLTPVIVVLGDISKMAGYCAGLATRSVAPRPSGSAG